MEGGGGRIGIERYGERKTRGESGGEPGSICTCTIHINLKVRCGSVQIKVMNSQNKTLFKEMPRVGFKPTTLCRRVLYLLSYTRAAHLTQVQCNLRRRDSMGTAILSL